MNSRMAARNRQPNSYVAAQRASGWSGILRVSPFIGSSLGQTVAMMSMSSAWGMLVEI